MSAPSTNGTNSLWVVEMWINEPRMKKTWAPTTAAHICRADARRDLDDWKLANRSDKFRLRRYRRIGR